MIFFASVPFGPNVNEYVAWIQHGGGYQLYEKGYAEHNIKGFQCGIVVADPPAGSANRSSLWMISRA